MVCKDELCSWFKNLSPHKRIDFMCGMLNMCLPMELRFMGSYVEDLAKKDFNHLRESESKANSRQELSNFNEKDGKTFRTKMAIYLALLHSSNRTCSNIIFQLLENNIKEAFTVMENMNEMTIHNILLVLAMAMNHPAFSYVQKRTMYGHYKTASEATRRLLQKPDPELFPQRLLSCETRLYDQGVSPAYSPRPPVHLSYSPVASNKVHVCNIEVKGSRVIEAEKRIVEYRMQVTWSNGEETEVYKTYQELEDFHNQLLQKFPEEARYLTQTLLLPNLQGPLNHKIENTVLLNEYTRSLSELPSQLTQCGFFVSFFVGGKVVPPASPPPPASSVQMMDASTSPRPQSVPDLPDLPAVNHIAANSGEDEPVIPLYPIMPQTQPQPVVYGTYMNQFPPSDVCSLPTQDLDNNSLSVNTVVAHSPSCSTKTTSPLISSPCHSSASSMMESPPLSNPTSPALPPGLPTGLPPGLLHETGEPGRIAPVIPPQYNELPGQYPTEQLKSLRLDESEVQNSTPEAAINMKNVIEMKAREKPVAPGQMPNGLMDHRVLWPQPGLHHPYLPPHAHAQFPYPPPLQQNLMYNGMYQVYPAVANSSAARDFSPSNSLNSSPSPSPCSSDDSEKDKHSSSQSTLNGKSKVHSVPNQARPPRLVKTAEDINLAAANENGNSLQGNSGYTSDPTYNATRPGVIRPSYKAQPAHTNVAIPQKFVINMPESGFKPGGPMVPFAIPQHVSMAATGNHGYNISEPGQRHLVYLPGGPALINRSYPINPMNNSRQIYGNGVLPSNPPMNHSVSSPSLAQGNPNTNGNTTSKVFQGSPAGPQLNPNMAKGNVLINGSENGAPTQPGVEHCAHRGPGNSSAVSSPTTVTYTSACPSVSGNHPTCTHCGCAGPTGHTPPQHQVFPFTNIHQVGQGMWSPYSNGLIPMHHQMFMHPNQPYQNGLNQEFNHLYNHPFGLINPGNQGAGMPNMYSCNMYNNPGSQNAGGGGYPKKPKKPNCHNCGSSKHMAGECNEVSMEAMSGQSMYSYKPKSDSD